MRDSFKLIGGGLATISLSGAGTGIGIVFAGSMLAAARNPFLIKQLFVYAISGFALTEAIALFGLMMAFLLVLAFQLCSFWFSVIIGRYSRIRN